MDGGPEPPPGSALWASAQDGHPDGLPALRQRVHKDEQHRLRRTFCDVPDLLQTQSLDLQYSALDVGQAGRRHQLIELRPGGRRRRLKHVVGTGPDPG